MPDRSGAEGEARPARPRLALVLVASAALGVACRSDERGTVQPRFASVQTALTALGMSQSGPLLHGTLHEGEDARVRLAVRAECATFVAIGSASIGDIDVSLRDEGDHVLAKDTSTDSQAVVRLCAAAPGNYTMVVHAARGEGEFLASMWTGRGDATSALAGNGGESGTCDTPTPLSPGTYVSSTSRGLSAEEGSCGTTDGKELVYQFTLNERRRVTLDIESQFDSVVYLRRDDCTDTAREVTCREAQGREQSKKTRIDTVLEAGVYYAIVDGSETGSFRLSLDTGKAPDLNALCRDAPALTSHATVNNWSTRVDLARATCGQSTGPEAPFRLDLPEATRVRIRHHYDGGSPVVHVRKTCSEVSSEVGCSDSSLHDNEAAYTGLLQAGHYVVYADTNAGDALGASEITYESQPANGRGTPEDTCAGALPLPMGEVTADTFDAQADVTNRCVPTATPDVFYRLAVPTRAHLTIHPVRSEAQHVVALYKSCGATPQLVTCGVAIDDVVPAGTYFVGVHGADPGSFGEVTLQTAMEDVTAREHACKAAPLLRMGETVRGNTKTASALFSTRCFGGVSPDRAYRFTLGKTTNVEAVVQATGFRGLVSIRATCLDSTMNAPAAGVGELNCGTDRGSGDARVSMQLPPGSYFVVVSGAQLGQEGAYSLKLQQSTDPNVPTVDIP